MLKSLRSTVLCALLWVSGFPLVANDIVLQYIEQYKTIAINEMQRVGIPASIKMAQAIIESNSGQSTLARQSNNHFGIKCGSNWTGPEVYREDDDYENGLLIRSCFRAFDDPVQSFFEHSDFLSNPKSNRYKPLFELDPYDFKAWAYGLKSAGYATDPNYPQKLIDVIEKYQLYELDLGIITIDELAHNEYIEEKNSNNKNVVIITPNSPNKSNPSGKKKSPKEEYAKRGFHKVAKEESMGAIASRYGIEVRKLYMQNRMPFGSVPRIGEQLAIDHFIHFKDTPDWTLPEGGNSSQEEFLFEETITIAAK